LFCPSLVSTHVQVSLRMWQLRVSLGGSSERQTRNPELYFRIHSFI